MRPQKRFNPRAHVGRDTKQFEKRYMENVSIHAPTWGATHILRRGLTTTCGFNPRAHVGRDWARTTRKCSKQCFNPRAHVGRDDFPRLGQRHIDVSIHAPTWGATDIYTQEVDITMFQSTRPRGARLGRREHRGGILCVSIHAPTWGATLLPLLSNRRLSSFNPRAHVGRDPIDRKRRYP